MKFIDEQKTEILNVLYEIYDEWQNLLNIATQNGDTTLVVEYEKNLDKALDTIERFKTDGEIDIPHVHLWSICIHAIYHGAKKDGE